MKYLAFNADNYDFEEFETIEEARKYCEDGFLNESYSQDTENYKIWQIAETVELKTIAEKKDFTDEQWEDEGYNEDFDTICKHEFIPTKI
jgi:hypothetical protein